MTEAPNPKVTLGQALALDIELRRKADLESKIKVFPRNQPILSDIGDCDRQIVYGVTNWQDREPFPVDVQARLEAGKTIEKDVIRELTGLGYTIILEQMPVEIRGRDGGLLARGKIDGMIVYHGQKIPFEVKSMQPHVYDRISKAEDMLRKPYMRKYLRQLWSYLYGHGLEHGLFILSNGLGGVKAIPLDLDYGECESILQRLERVDKHLKAKTLPDRIDYNADICDHCAFAKVCLPDVMRKEADVLADESLIAMLERREEIKVVAKEYDEIDESIKKTIKSSDIKRGIAGGFVIDVKTIKTEARTIEIPAGEQKRIQIKRL